jgi:hypothetical protein
MLIEKKSKEWESLPIIASYNGVSGNRSSSNGNNGGNGQITPLGIPLPALPEAPQIGWQTGATATVDDDLCGFRIKRIRKF